LRAEIGNCLVNDLRQAEVANFYKSITAAFSLVHDEDIRRLQVSVVYATLKRRIKTIRDLP